MSSERNATSDPFFSVVVPCRNFNGYLRQSLAEILKQNDENFEIIVLPDQPNAETFPKTTVIPAALGPAQKRNLALKSARGEVLAFIDDDAYPNADWLKRARPHFQDPEIAAVCGPGLTPPTDSLWQKASGWVSASLLGGGPFSFRFFPGLKREVDDFPSMNFLVRRRDFEAVQGFDSDFWPGEDTKLCLDLTRKLGKKIIYDPAIRVYHHRRPLFEPHLKQVGEYGRHRGYFARVLPQTSRRLSYFLPSLFVTFLLIFPIVAGFLPAGWWLYRSVVSLYLLLLMLTSIWVWSKEKNAEIALLVVPGILATHLWYGLKFLQGFFSPRLER